MDKFFLKIKKGSSPHLINSRENHIINTLKVLKKNKINPPPIKKKTKKKNNEIIIGRKEKFPVNSFV
jgi:hypothetical protein